MKRMITKLAVVAIVVLFGTSLTTSAQVVPGTTAGTKYFCNDGVLDLGTPAANTTWIVRYSATSTTTPLTSVTLAANKIEDTELKTGFYYIISKGTAAGSCESAMQEIPVYKFKPLTADFTYADYCSENAATTTFTATGTSTDGVTTFAYQWYTVVGTTETEISGQTAQTYSPTELNTTNADITKKYRVKIGYLIGTDKYCGTIADHDVKVLAKPTTPTVTITTAGETW